MGRYILQHETILLVPHPRERISTHIDYTHTGTTGRSDRTRGSNSYGRAYPVNANKHGEIIHTQVRHSDLTEPAEPTVTGGYQL